MLKVVEAVLAANLGNKLTQELAVGMIAMIKNNLSAAQQTAQSQVQAESKTTGQLVESGQAVSDAGGAADGALQSPAKATTKAASGTAARRRR